MYINDLNRNCSKCGQPYTGKGLKCNKCKTDSDAWATPLELFQKGCSIFGFKPTLDAAANKNNTKCRHLTFSILYFIKFTKISS